MRYSIYFNRLKNYGKEQDLHFEILGGDAAPQEEDVIDIIILLWKYEVSNNFAYEFLVNFMRRDLTYPQVSHELKCNSNWYKQYEQ